jgi:hypothetical protein
MIKQNPFSLYDFMGYFIPGALLLYIYLVIEYIKKNHSFNLINFLNENDDVKLPNLMFFLILSYSLGHLINFTSSVTIEKYANWKYNFPSKYLLGLEKNKYWKTEGFSDFMKKLTIPIFILPVTLMDLVLGDMLGFKQFYTKKLDDFLIEIIRGNGEVLIRKIHSNFKSKKKDVKEINLTDKDFFRLFMHYTFENSKNHQFKLINYVALYGFLRTLTLISVILFWYFIYYIFKYSNFSVQTVIIITLISFISYIFFMAFMKFYRRYSLEGLMLIAIDKELFDGEKD